MTGPVRAVPGAIYRVRSGIRVTARTLSLLALFGLATGYGSCPGQSSPDGNTADAADVPAQLTDAHDLLWLTGHDREKLEVQTRQMLEALDDGKIPDVESARQAAIHHAIDHGEMRAEERVNVVSLIRMGRPVPGFAQQGDLVWVVRFIHLSQGVTQELWIESASGRLRAQLPGSRK